jgi:hypothetical protein
LATEATLIFSRKLVALFQLQHQDALRHLEFHLADRLVLLAQLAQLALQALLQILVLLV